jgi:hypothetical protein
VEYVIDFVSGVGSQMTKAFLQLKVGDRVKYIGGTISLASRGGEVGIVTAVFSDDATGAFRANVRFSDGVQPAVRIDQLERI